MPSRGSLVAVLAAVVPALAVGALQAVSAGPSSAAAGQESDESAREIWLSDCAVCHGNEGQGTDRGPDLDGVGTASLDYVLRTGRMPIHDPDDEIRRRRPAYDDGTIDALVEYAASLDAGQVGVGPAIPDVDAGAGDVAAGGEIWRLQCAACHRWSGDGGALTGETAPDVRPATPRVLGEAVRTGPFAMPRFGRAAIDDDGLNDLAAYVEERIDHPSDEGGWSMGHIGPVAEGAMAMVVGLGLLVVMTRALGTREAPLPTDDETAVGAVEPVEAGDESA